jgi:hypothetical protein
MLDRSFRARPVEVLPRAGDVLDEPAALVRAGGESAVRGRAPDPSRGGAEDLVPSSDGEGELVQGSAQPLHQQRLPVLVVAQQGGTAVTARQLQRPHLVPEVVAGTRDDQLQHRRAAVGQ